MATATALDRRAFLKGAVLTALAAAGGAAPAGAAGRAERSAGPPNGRYDFDEVIDRVGTDCYKWDKQIELFGEDRIVVPMGIADMDFRTAPVITRALLERLEHENWGYMHVPPSFKASMVDWNRRRYDEDIDPDLLLTATGVLPGILSGLRAFAPPGSKVLLQTPVYSSFYSIVRKAHCVPEESPMKLVDGRYRIDFEDLERRIDHDTNVLILCNPQNPTGNCWTRDELATLGELCHRRRVVVFADEIHCDFVRDRGRYTPFGNLGDEAVVRNSVTFKSTSKSFNLAATKCAYLYSRNADYIERIRQTGHNETVNTLGVIASETAYNEGEDWLDQALDYIDGNMAFTERYIAERVPLIRFVKPEGTYLAWLDVSALAERIGADEMAAEANRQRGPDEEPLAPEHMIERWLVEHAGVQLNDGHRYGLGGEGHMRMNLATSRILLEKALDNIASATRRA